MSPLEEVLLVGWPSWTQTAVLLVTFGLLLLGCYGLARLE